MTGALARTEAVLRAAETRKSGGANEIGWKDLVLCTVLFGSVYGAVMGSFGGFTNERVWQIIFSAAKVPIMLLGTFSICLPSFFVLNTLAGLRSDFQDALRALLATQACVTIALSSLAPMTAVYYLSTTDYNAAVLFNGGIFATASLAGQFLLRGLYKQLLSRNRQHQRMLMIWLSLYIFVGVQLGWILRPFVGEPTVAVQFIRSEAWGNAYVEIAHHFLKLFGH